MVKGKILKVAARTKKGVQKYAKVARKVGKDVGAMRGKKIGSILKHGARAAIKHKIPQNLAKYGARAALGAATGGKSEVALGAYKIGKAIHKRGLKGGLKEGGKIALEKAASVATRGLSDKVLDAVGMVSKPKKRKKTKTMEAIPR